MKISKIFPTIIQIVCVMLFAVGIPTFVGALSSDLYVFSGSTTLDPSITFSRASTATRINASGTLETVSADIPRFSYDPVTLSPKGFLIETGSTNLITNTSGLKAPGWSIFNQIGGSGQILQNVALAPDGTMTADSFQNNGTGGAFIYFVTSPSYATGTIFTFSIYIKTLSGGITTAGNVGWGGAANGTSTGAYTIIDAGNGWKRFSWSFITDKTNGNVWPQINLPSQSSVVAYWGPQLEVGTTATSLIVTTGSTASRASDQTIVTIPPNVTRLNFLLSDNTTSVVSVTPNSTYTFGYPSASLAIQKVSSYYLGTPTQDLSFRSGSIDSILTYTRSSIATRVNSSGYVTTVTPGTPRIDYDSLSGSVLGLLIEPTSTNLIPYSSLSSGWSRFDQSGGSGQVVSNYAVSPTGLNDAAAIVNTSGSGQTFYYYVISPTASSGTTFTFSAYVKSLSGSTLVSWGGASDGIAGTQTVSDVGNGWYKYVQTFTTNVANGRVWPSIYAIGGGATTLVYGAQLEQGTVATSLIPTNGTQMTRSADQVSFIIPAGITQMAYVFDDESTQVVTVTPGAEYTIPTDLSRARIRDIIFSRLMPPSGLILQKTLSGALLSWNPPIVNTGSVITDYRVEYRIHTGSTWSTYSDGVSISTGVLLTGLDPDIVYDYRMSAVNSIGTGIASSYVTGFPVSHIYYGILSTGQSLSVCGGYPISTNTQNNVYTLGSSTTSYVASFLGLLKESGCETPSSGIAKTVEGFDTRVPLVPYVISLHGVGGTAYAGLKKGTAPYSTGMLQASLAKSLIEAQGDIYRPFAITSIHGEADAGVSSGTYLGYLTEWQRDYEADLNALMGSTGLTIPMYINQMHSNAVSVVRIDQLNAHRTSSGKILLVGPKYQYTYSDNVHLVNISERHMGEMLGKVMYKVGVLGQTWNPLMPTKVERINNIVTVDFLSPTGDIVFDTGAVAERLNYGFDFYQSGASLPNITSVEIMPGTTRVRITLDQVPTGTDQRIRYAYRCYAYLYGNCGGAGTGTSIGGNLRDTDSSVSPSVDSTGLPLYDWAVTFDEPITPIVPPSQVLSLSGSVANPLLTLSWITPTSSGGSDITDYSIEYKPTLDSTWITYPHAVSTGTTLTLSGLTHNMSYDFRVSALNRAGTGTVSSTLTLIAKNDIIPPVLTLSGSSPYQIAQGSTYTEPGVIWSDNIDGSGVLLTSTITASGTLSISGSVNTTQIGTYTLNYLYTDTSGNTGSVQRNVQVVDRDTPLLTLIGTSPLIIAQTAAPTTYVDSGALWTDNVDGSGVTTPGLSTLTGSVTTDASGALIYPLGGFILSGSVDTTLTGTYLITYTRIDQAGNRGMITRTITVTDQTPPTVGASLYTYVQSGSILSSTTIPTYPTNRPVTVTLGTPSELISINNNNLTSTGAPNPDPRSYIFTQNGTFTFLYQDMAGNTGSTMVTVSNIDTISPSVTLNAQNPMVILEGATWSDPGALWSDNIDGTGVLSTASTGTVATSIPGTYTLTYTYTDRAGNTSTLNRVVIVQPVSHAGGGGGSVSYIMSSHIDPEYLTPQSNNNPIPTQTPQVIKVSLGSGDIVPPLSPVALIESFSSTGRSTFDMALVPRDQKPLYTSMEIRAVDTPQVPAYTPMITLIRYGVMSNQKYAEPRKFITRAEFIKVLTRMSGYTQGTPPSTPSGTNTFRDLTDTSPELSQYIAYGVTQGWVNSKNTHFRPNDPITLGEVNKLIATLQKKATATTQATSSSPILRYRAADLLLRGLGVPLKKISQ